VYELKGMWKKVGHIKLLDQHLSNEVKKNHREPQDGLPLGQDLNQGAPEYNRDL
jgi:ribulose 1,5-bisphosphate carboxylase large subunit-like protein